MELFNIAVSFEQGREQHSHIWTGYPSNRTVNLPRVRLCRARTEVPADGWRSHHSFSFVGPFPAQFWFVRSPLVGLFRFLCLRFGAGVAFGV